MTGALSPFEIQLKHFKQYLDRPEVFEIRINKPGEIVCDTFKGTEIIKDDNLSSRYLSDICQSLCAFNGIENKDINNVVLPDGSRGIICHKSAVIPGTVAIAFRKNVALNKDIQTLTNEGAFDFCQAIASNEVGLSENEKELIDLHKREQWSDFLMKAVALKKTIVVAGATGSGKTVLTRALTKAISPDERAIVMEDVHEVEIAHLNEAVYMLYGAKGQKGRVSPADCLKACMRLTPERIFMTELRDEAAWDYLQALNTGHPGGLTSTHANSSTDAFNRIGLLIKATEIGRMLEMSDIMKMLYSTIDVVVYMENRKIKEIYFDPHYKLKCVNGN